MTVLRESDGRGIRKRLGAMATASTLEALRPFGTAAAIAFVLFLAFSMAMLPKSEYAYPLHVDEWLHYDLAWQLEHNGKVVGESQVEGGFHALLAGLRTVTGLDWLTLFRWLPPTFFTITVFLCYLVGRRYGCGLESATLATLMPTTIRLLGPAFLVPVAIGLLAFPLLLLLLHHERFGWRHAILAALVLLFTGATHPTSAILLAAVVVVHAIVVTSLLQGTPLRKRALTGAQYLSAAAIPALLMAVLRWEEMVRVAATLVRAGTPTLLPFTTEAASKFGMLPTLLFFPGAFFLVLRTAWQGIALAASALLLLIVILVYHELLIGYQSLADRAWFHLLVIVAVVGGYGVHHLGRTLFVLVSRFWKRAARPVGVALASGLLAACVVGAVRSHQREYYYQMMTDATMADFQWIAQYLQPEKRLAVTRVDVAFAYPPLTGGKVFVAQAWPFIDQPGREVTWFLFGGPGRNENWWRQQKITLIYAPHWTEGPPGTDGPRPGIFIPSSMAP